MNVCVCVDDNLGLTFNKRRQSRDRKQIEDMISFCGKTLYIDSYSAPLFDGTDCNVYITDDFESVKDGWCFIENKPITGSIKALVLYKWNRKYPCDTKLCVDFSKLRLEQTVEFEGSSHDKITREVWVNDNI